MNKQIINGKYTSATVFTTDNPSTSIDPYAVAQLQMLCDIEANSNAKIKVMPDVHPGKVGTIGLTMTVHDKLMPNLTGIDIGCGISMIQIKNKNIEFQKLDTVIRDHIPSGFHVRKDIHHKIDAGFLYGLKCIKHIPLNQTLLSCGSLGSGNHFIEIDKDQNNNHFVVVHSGSRRLGKDVTEFYLKRGQAELKADGIDLPYELTYLQGELMKDYLHDISIVQELAQRNRAIILEELAKNMKWKVTEQWSCHHNYIDFSEETIHSLGAPLLRKGAISAKKDEMVIIPINMHDGIIIGKGLGNVEWNCSAPHGSGRIMKREDVKKQHTLSQFKKVMNGIYSPSITSATLDEAPFAYRGIDDIAETIKETVQITNILTPVYNFKAGGQ